LNVTVELSVAIPCYNEEENLPAAVPRLVSILREAQIDFELIFIDDGSGDRTAEILQGFIDDGQPVRLVRHPVNQGWGGAVRSGYEASSGRYFAFMVADEQVSFDTIPVVYEMIRDQPLGVLAKVRRVTRSNEPLRKVYSFIYNRLMNRLFRTVTTDHNGTPKILRHEDFARLRPTHLGNFFDVELVTRAMTKGFRIIELDVPSVVRSRGTSHISSTQLVKEPLRLLREALQFRAHGESQSLGKAKDQSDSS